ncbi:MAG: SusC/RagA family TonB-linked outer membrane protein [Bacteroidales bacterium]
MRKFTFILLVMCLTLLASSVYAQKTVTGKVTDESGLGIPGATVVQKGTTKGTLTDVDGKFSVSVSEDAILQVSFMGMLPQEISVSGKNTIDIALKDDVQGLEEVVVVGYGTQKKVNLTGAVGTVKAEELENRSTGNTIAAMQGTVPGAVITRSSGVPGQEGYNIQIRGATSINNNPVLVLIDGVEGSLDMVQPEDIESISILKDAAAAAIYGSRSAGGVILVTTKKGKEGKVTVSYSGLFTINRPARMPTPMPMGELAVMQNEARTNAGLSASWSQETIDKINDPNIWYETDPSNTNAWQWFGNNNYVDLALESSIPQQNHNISIAGGSEKLTYRLSTTYFQKQGLLTYGDDDNDRLSMRMSLASEINKYVRVETDASFYRNYYEQPSDGSVEGSYSHIYRIYSMRGIYPIYTPIGNLTGLAARLEAGTAETTKDRYQINGRAYFQNFVKGLKFSLIGSLRSDNNGVFSYLRKAPIIGADGTTVIGQDISRADQVYRSSTEVLKKDFQFLIDYDKSFNKHNFHVLAGYSFEDYRYVSWNATANNLINSNLPSFDWADVGTYKASDDIRANAFQAVFGRLNYNFDERYLFEANLRYDGSSKLAPEARYKLFPSFSFA